jgi:hypothetical protein
LSEESKGLPYKSRIVRIGQYYIPSGRKSPVVVTDSQELDAYYNINKDKPQFGGYFFQPPVFKDSISMYDEEFFKDSYIVFIEIANMSSGSIHYKVDGVSENGEISISDNYKEGMIMTDDIANWLVIVELEKSLMPELHKGYDRPVVTETSPPLTTPPPTATTTNPTSATTTTSPTSTATTQQSVVTTSSTKSETSAITATATKSDTATTATAATESRKIGDVDGNGTVTINDAIEILKSLAKLPSVLDKNPDSVAAACIVSESVPTIDDVLEILKYLAKIDSVIGG